MAKLKKLHGNVLELKTQAFPFQREAIDTVRNLPYSAVFFEQGLGKTKIAIDLTLDWLTEGLVDTVVIVTKKGLIRNWIEEFGTHSNVIPRILSSDTSANHRAFFSPARVYLANFEAIAKEKTRIRLLAKHRRMAIILDESQKIKNPESALTQAYFEISSCFKKRLIMTGTPMANRPYDIWAQIYFLDGGESLGKEFKIFKSELDIPKEEVTRKYTDALTSVFPKIASFAIRQTKSGSGLELPGKQYSSIVADWEERQRKMYESVRDKLRLQVTRDNHIVVDDAEALLKRLLRLVQISSNPGVIDQSYDRIPGKLTSLFSILENLPVTEEKAIVWTSFVDNCRYLRAALKKYGAVQLHGRMSIEDRDRSVSKFKKDDDVRVLVATPAAAKEGLTLTIANHVVYFDRSFSLDDYRQSQDRIHRISQTKTCYIHNIELPDSIDQWTEALIGIKSAAVDVAMGERDADEFSRNFNMNLSEILKAILNV